MRVGCALGCCRAIDVSGGNVSCANRTASCGLLGMDGLMAIGGEAVFLVMLSGSCGLFRLLTRSFIPEEEEEGGACEIDVVVSCCSRQMSADMISFVSGS